MKTTYTVGIKDLAELLLIANKIGDPNWEVAGWILDTLGYLPESDHDWNALTKEELDCGFGKDGMALCCRDAMHELHCEPRDEEMTRTRAIAVITTWIEAIRVGEQARSKI
jgi:hypothetical protein